MDAIDGPIFGRNLILQLTASTCLALGVELLPGTQVPSHASFYGISQGTFSTDAAPSWILGGDERYCPSWHSFWVITIVQICADASGEELYKLKFKNIKQDRQIWLSHPKMPNCRTTQQDSLYSIRNSLQKSKKSSQVAMSKGFANTRRQAEMGANQKSWPIGCGCAAQPGINFAKVTQWGFANDASASPGQPGQPGPNPSEWKNDRTDQYHRVLVQARACAVFCGVIWVIWVICLPGATCGMVHSIPRVAFPINDKIIRNPFSAIFIHFPGVSAHMAWSEHAAVPSGVAAGPCTASSSTEVDMAQKCGTNGPTKLRAFVGGLNIHSREYIYI